MKRKIALLLCILIAAVTLTACQSDEEIQTVQMIPQNISSITTPVPEQQLMPQDNTADFDTGEDFYPGDNGVSVFDQNPYLQDAEGFTAEDALWEEETNLDDDVYYNEDYNNGNEFAFDYSIGPTVYPYAGSTPIPLDPVDMPTPTPRPTLSFTYTPYTASALGLTFEAPYGWNVDESSNYQSFVLTEPESQMHDNFCCEVSISAENVTETYSQKNLATYVKQRMATIYESRLKTYDPSSTAKRYMLGKEGVYMNYTGKLLDGTEVGGRILYVCIDHTLYGLEIIYPLAYKDDYLNVFGQIRTTMKTVN